MKSIFTSLLLTAFVVAEAQSGYTLQGAVDYALANNGNHLNVILDQQMAEMKKKEITGMGLPQIGGKVEWQDYVKIPTSLIPASAFGGPAGQFIPVQFGIQYNASAGISVSQLIFSSDYVVALQASKSYLELSQLNVNRSKTETTVNVSKAYYNVLVSRERAKFIDVQLVRVKKFLDNAKELNAAGFVEKLDVDRVTLGYNNLLSEKEKVARLVELTEYLLKFQMGMVINEKITLSDSLMVGDTTGNFSPTGKFDYSLRSDYAMLEMQLKLNELELKRQKLMWMPSLAAYGTYSENAMRPKFNFFDFDQKWYPTGIVGVRMTVPIWDGGQTHFKKQQAKLQVSKTQNTMKMMENVIDLEIQSSTSSFRNALLTLSMQKDNIALAEEVYSVSKTKYEQGVGSILEVIDAETSLKQAQLSYYDALYQYHIAKIDFEKAAGLIK